MVPIAPAELPECGRAVITAPLRRRWPQRQRPQRRDRHARPPKLSGRRVRRARLRADARSGDGGVREERAKAVDQCNCAPQMGVERGSGSAVCSEPTLIG
jgi:hypothetical protein